MSFYPWDGRAPYGRASFAGAGSDRLSVGEGLTEGQYIVSADGRFALGISGGNAYIHKHADPSLALVKVLGGGGKATRILFGSFGGQDGLSVVDAAGKSLWNTFTATMGRGGTRLVMQNDGNLVIYTAGGAAIWASNTSGVSAPYPAAPAPAPAPTLAPAPSQSGQPTVVNTLSPPPPSGPSQTDVTAAAAAANAANAAYQATVSAVNAAIASANTHGAPEAVAAANAAQPLAGDAYAAAVAAAQAAQAGDRASAEAHAAQAQADLAAAQSYARQAADADAIFVQWQAAQGQGQPSSGSPGTEATPPPPSSPSSMVQAAIGAGSSGGIVTSLVSKAQDLIISPGPVPGLSVTSAAPLVTPSNEPSGSLVLLYGAIVVGALLFLKGK